MDFNLFLFHIFNTNLFSIANNKNIIKKVKKIKHRVKLLSYFVPSIWNKLPEKNKDSNNLNNFKHKIKEHFFKEREKRDNDFVFKFLIFEF